MVDGLNKIMTSGALGFLLGKYKHKCNMNLRMKNFKDERMDL